ncbi:DUF2971 domain-containing protein [Brachyspira intermedia]|uniref:DUF2971 domain-containing protein n=2 Tax=Brachyspira TaxID=29521 RepID=UPI003007E4BE
MSLDEELERINIEDTNHIMILQNIIADLNKYEINDYNKVLNLLYEIEKKYPKYFIVTTLIAEILYNSDNEEYIKDSIKYYNKTIYLISELKDVTVREQLWKCNCYGKIANFYFDRKEYPNASYNYENILNILENIKNKDDKLMLFTADNYFANANAYYNEFLKSGNMDNIEIMFEYYNKAIDSYNLIDNKDYNIMKNIGMCHYQIANINLKCNMHNLTITNFDLKSEMFDVCITNFNAAISNFQYILENSVTNLLSNYQQFEINFKIAESYFYLGYIYYLYHLSSNMFQCYENAMFYYNNSFKLISNTDDTKNQIVVLNQIGILYSYFGNYKLSVNIYKYAVNIIGDIKNIKNDPQLYLSIYINLASSYIKDKNYDKAIEISKYLYDNIENIGLNNEHDITSIILSLSIIYAITRKYDEAITILKKAINENYTHYDIYHNLGRCLIEKGNYKEGIYYISKSNREQSKAYLAYAHLKLNENEKAYDILDELVKDNLNYDVFIILYRMYKEGILDKSKAKNVFEKILKKNIESYISNNINNIKDNILYQYIPWYSNNIPDEVKDLIENEQIEFRNPTTFNDPIDPPTKLLKKDDILYELTNNFQISCLTTEPYNILMWAHYANKHNGICIAYDITDFLNEKDVLLEKLMYTTKLTFDYENELDSFFNIEDKYHHLSSDNIYPLHLFLTKNVQWSYENEFRLIKYIDNIDDINYIDGYDLIKYIDVKDKSKKIKIRKKLHIKHIYLGKDIEEKDQEIIKNIADKKNIPVLKIKYKESNLYELESYDL